MSYKQYVIVTAAAVLGAVVAAFLIPEQAIGIPTLGPQYAIENIAPGQEVISWAISLDADTNADFLEYPQGDGDGATGDPDIWPIPHGSRITVKLRDATETTCCFVGDVNQATTTLIGAQSGNTTKFEVNNGSNGACFSLVGAGDSWTSVVNYFALAAQGLMPAGVCNTETVNNANTGYDVFGVCAADADCDQDGGHPASTTCNLSPSSVLNYNTGKLPGVYMACRSLGATDVDYTVSR